MYFWRLSRTEVEVDETLSQLSVSTSGMTISFLSFPSWSHFVVYTVLCYSNDDVCDDHDDDGNVRLHAESGVKSFQTVFWCHPILLLCCVG